MNHPTPNRIIAELKFDWNSLSEDFIIDANKQLDRLYAYVQECLEQNNTFQEKKKKIQTIWELILKNPITQKAVEIALSGRITHEIKKLCLLAIALGVNKLKTIALENRKPFLY